VRHAFWADGRKAESEIFAQFLDVVTRHEALRLYCYGNYEKTFITRMRRQARRKKRVDAVLAALTNVLTIIYPHVYFPTYSNGLKEVGAYLGCHWSEPEASSISSVVWRKNWERTGKECWKEKLLQYNLEDCHALRKVCDFLSERPADAPGRGHRHQVSALQRPGHRSARSEAATQGGPDETQTGLRPCCYARSDPAQGDRIPGRGLSLFRM